jgi:hypothetical protein
MRTVHNTKLVLPIGIEIFITYFTFYFISPTMMKQWEHPTRTFTEDYTPGNISCAPSGLGAWCSHTKKTLQKVYEKINQKYK